MAVKDLNSQEFDNAVSTGVTVVDFWAPWCGPCKMMEPAVKELSEEMADVNFYKLNVDQNQDISIRFKVMSIPTILIFKDGDLKDTSIGVLSKDMLESKIKTIM